ncbi:MAG: alkaline phosphatase family protein [Nanohaloarchaea archaeon]|nr:alkaline phosphatase family protein [Candidatus Nanohaloarchaea archaeon]
MTTYIIGMDGMDKQIVEENIEEFPNLSELTITGLESVTPPITVPAWACSFSGLNPDKLETFDFQMVDVKTYEFSPANHEFLQKKGFWNYWNDSSTIFSIPGTETPKLDGYSLGGFFDLENLETHPESLRDEIEEEIGEIEITNMFDLNSEKERREAAYHNFEVRKKIFDLLLEKNSDVYFPVFRLPDTMMHHTDSEKHMVESYREVDSFVGELRDKMSEDDNLLIVSDHGAVKAKRRFFINTWLKQNGFAKQKEGEENSFLDDLAMKLGDIGQRLGFRDLLVKLNNLAQEKAGKNFAPRKTKALDSMAWQETEAFSYMTGVCAYAGIWINDERFSKGVVENTQEKKQEIASELEKRKEVNKVRFREEVYEEDIEKFPDLIVEFYEDTKAALGFHPEVTASVSSYMHRKEGVLMAEGSNIVDSDEEAELIDLAPTLLHLHDYPVPNHMDGEVLEMVKKGDVEKEVSEVAGLDI